MNASMLLQELGVKTSKELTYGFGVEAPKAEPKCNAEPGAPSSHYE